MEDSRKLLDHFYVCCNKMDGLYYLAARRLGVKENALVLLYTLNDGQPRSQKQLSEELLIPKTTINTIVGRPGGADGGGDRPHPPGPVRQAHRRL